MKEAAVLANGKPPGVRVAFGGGDGNRGIAHEVSCSAGEPLQTINSTVDYQRSGDGFSTEYTVHWSGDVGCGKPTSCPPNPPTPLPQPTLPQLAWQQHEIMALIHFNMATFFHNGDPGCDAASQQRRNLLEDTDRFASPPLEEAVGNLPVTSRCGSRCSHFLLTCALPMTSSHSKANWPNSSKPASFAPDKLNVSQWIGSMKALGVKEAVLTAKHGCGFLLWNTSTTLPSGEPYTYHVPPHLNVLQQFSDAMKAEGLGE